MKQLLYYLFKRKNSQKKITNIAIISPQMYQIFNPKKNYKYPFGGAEVQLSLLAKELYRQNIEVHVLVADYGQPFHEIIDGIHFWKGVHLSANPLIKSLKFFFAMLKVPSKIFVRKGFTLANTFIALSVRFFGGKFIHIIAHDLETDNIHKTYKNLLKRNLALMGLKIPSYTFSQNHYQHYNLKQQNIENIILPSLTTIPSDNIFPSLNSYILWVGRAEEWKRPKLFLELVKSMPSYKFVMICPPSKNTPQLNTYIQKTAQRFPNLTFISFVPLSEIEEYFKNATLFVNTSTQEGFPNTFIQSMKYGTPLISFSVNPNNIISEHSLGHICNDSIQQACKYITNLYNNREHFQNISRNCYTYVKETHDVVKNTKHFLQTIQK